MIKVSRISSEIADTIHKIQKECFNPLLKIYEDYDLSPAMESVEKIKEKIDRNNTIAYIFEFNGINVGWVRVIEYPNLTFKIAALCILPEYQNKGLAQEALKQIESFYPNAKRWILDTILQEKGNCHLYEKIGYVRFGDVIPINDRMTIVSYEKYVNNKKTYTSRGYHE